MNAPHVISLAHATTGPAVYPAGSAAALTSVPAPASLRKGGGTLDEDGQVTVFADATSTVCIPVFSSGTGIGPLNCYALGSGSFSIVSSAAGEDVDKGVSYIAF